MPIVPDTKDWTWVLGRPCPELRFRAADHPTGVTGCRVRTAAAAWSEQSTRGDVRVPATTLVGARVRVPRPRRVPDLRHPALLLTEVDPGFPDWDQDGPAVGELTTYEDPSGVRSELTDAAATLGSTSTGVGDQWDRTGRRSNGSAFTVGTLGSYLIHDPIHHLWDVSSR